MREVPSPKEITAILTRMKGGDRDAVNQLTPLLYSELHGLAERAMRGQSPGHTLQATAVVHEAYLKMLGQTHLGLENRAHFLAVAARAMRQILIDHARTRRRKKRGGDARRVVLDPVASPAGISTLDLLALDEALTDLCEHDERKARVVELAFFGGLTHEEVAEVLEITTRTVRRDWNYAQAWLRRRLARNAPGSGSETDDV